LATTLPAPLFFESKARDYMARFAIDDVDADEGAFGSTIEEFGLVAPEITEETATPDEDEGQETEILDAAEAAASQAPSESASAASNVGPPREPSPTEEAMPTLTGSWSRLLRGSLAVSLIESTSLSGSRVELPLVRKRSAIGLESLPTKWLGNRAGEQREEMTDTEMKDAVPDPNWIHDNRDKLLPVPNFVTPEWLLPKISLQGNIRLLKDIHRWRQEIRDDTGFAWPAQCPEGLEIAEVMISGMRHANFIRVLSRVAARCLDPRKREGFNLFTPFRKHTSWSFDSTTTKGRRPTIRRQRRSVSDAVRALVDAGMSADAQAMIYLMCLGTEPAANLSEVAHELDFTALDEFFDAASVLDVGFSWARDVIEQTNSPTIPPQPRDDDPVGLTPPDCPVVQNESPEPDVVPNRADVGQNEDVAPHRDDPDTVADAEETAVVEAAPDADVEANTHASLALTGDVHGGSAQGRNLNDHEAPVVDAVTMPPSPKAGGHAPNQDIAGGAAESARSSWQQAMTRLLAIAARAQAADPDGEVVREVVKAVRSARVALQAWEMARPRLADAWPTILRARDILDRLATLQRAPQTDGILTIGKGPVMVDPGILQDAELLVEEASIALQEASKNETLSLSISGKDVLIRWTEIAALIADSDRAMQLTAARISAADSIPVEGMVRAIQTSPPVPYSSAIFDALNEPPLIEVATSVTVTPTVSENGWQEPPVSNGEPTAAKDKTEHNLAQPNLPLAAEQPTDVDVSNCPPDIMIEPNPVEDPDLNWRRLTWPPTRIR
jgi:hypothetical protein